MRKRDKNAERVREVEGSGREPELYLWERWEALFKGPELKCSCLPKSQ